MTLRAGQRFVITTARVLGDTTRVSTTFRPLPREVHRGNRILLSDGLIELRVQQVRGQEVICEVVNGGVLGEHKGINLPGIQASRSGPHAKGPEGSSLRPHAGRQLHRRKFRAATRKMWFSQKL